MCTGNCVLYFDISCNYFGSVCKVKSPAATPKVVKLWQRSSRCLLKSPCCVEHASITTTSACHIWPCFVMVRFILFNNETIWFRKTKITLSKRFLRNLVNYNFNNNWLNPLTVSALHIGLLKQKNKRENKAKTMRE